LFTYTASYYVYCVAKLLAYTISPYSVEKQDMQNQIKLYNCVLDVQWYIFVWT